MHPYKDTHGIFQRNTSNALSFSCFYVLILLFRLEKFCLNFSSTILSSPFSLSPGIFYSDIFLLVLSIIYLIFFFSSFFSISFSFLVYLFTVSSVVTICPLDSSILTDLLYYFYLNNFFSFLFESSFLQVCRIFAQMFFSDCSISMTVVLQTSSGKLHRSDVPVIPLDFCCFLSSFRCSSISSLS